ncbi:MAG: hypothetical protein H7A25_06870 [Leptospiraceae bacterium]|nr:hypothetical protein [Leptospiraceae bacterium]
MYLLCLLLTFLFFNSLKNSALNTKTFGSERVFVSSDELLKMHISKKTAKEEWEYSPKRLYETYFNRKAWGKGKELSIKEFICK